MICKPSPYDRDASSRRNAKRTWWPVAAAAAGAAVQPGCLSNPAELPVTRVSSDVVLTSPAVAMVEADWEDVGPSLRAALNRCAVAATSQRWFSEGVPIPPGAEPLDQIALLDPRAAHTCEIEVVLPWGEVGTLVIERLPNNSGGGLDAMRMTCQIGTSGSPEREACVVDALAWRLRQLAGVEFAPLSWPTSSEGWSQGP